MPDQPRSYIVDLDGVVYRGPDPVPHAVEALGQLNAPVAFATNNASRTIDDIAGHLRSLGLVLTNDQIVTSAVASANVCRERYGAGAEVLAIGGDGLLEALASADLRPVSRLADSAEGVRAAVQGYGSEVTASDLAEVAFAVSDGAAWVATNTDATLPSSRGIAPGNGAFVAAVASTVGREPDLVIGKPHPPLFIDAASRLGVSPALVVGDRLDTDIAGAKASGLSSLLVLTGVHSLADAMAAEAASQPDFVAHDLRALLAPLPQLSTDDSWSVCGDDVRRIVQGRWEIRRQGSATQAMSNAVAAARRARGCGDAEPPLVCLADEVMASLAVPQ